MRRISRAVWRGRAATIVLLATVLGLAACDRVITTKIGTITHNPRDWDGKLVTVAGQVTASANIIVVKTFSVKDDTGEIMVVTDRAVPKEGDKVRVHGRVNEAFSIGSESLVVIKEQQ